MTLLPATRQALARNYTLPALTQSTATQLDSIHVCDALDFVRSLPNGFVDAVITDPPYGLGIDTWDVAIDIDRFVIEVDRILKPTGFFGFYIQMPMLVDWHVSITKNTSMLYRDHIAWIKRQTSVRPNLLNPQHEEFLIYRHHKAQYRETRGTYADVRLPGYIYGILTVQTIERHIADLRIKANGGQPSKAYGVKSHPAYSHLNMSSDRSPEYVNFTNVWSFLPENNRIKNNKASGHHATVKPIKMVKRLCELLTDKEALIVDPFMGSGTTAVAARQLGRHYIGCDLNPEYVDMARDRLAQPYTPDMFYTLEEQTA